MSVKSVAQNFEHKSFATNNNNNNNIKGKPPNSIFNNNREICRGERAKSEKNPSYKSQLTNTASSTTTNELSNFKFKNSSLKKTRHSSLVRAPTNTTTPAIRLPPTDDELRVKAPVEEKTTQQLKNEEELKNLTSGSVLNRTLLLFEKSGGNTDTDVVGLLKRRSTKSGSFRPIVDGEGKKVSSDPTKSTRDGNENDQAKDDSQQKGLKQEMMDVEKGKESNTKVEHQLNVPVKDEVLEDEEEKRKSDDDHRELSATSATTSIQKTQSEAVVVKMKTESVYEVCLFVDMLIVEKQCS